MVLNKLAEKNRNILCSVPFLYIFKDKKKFCAVLSHILKTTGLILLKFYIQDPCIMRECDITVMLRTYFITHFNFTMKNEGTQIMQLNMFYLTLLIFDWYIKVKTLPVVLSTLNALDFGSIQMWYVMNNLAARIFLILHNLPATLAICIVS